MPDRSQWLIAKSEVASDEAIVATMYPNASEVGAGILARGGNAIDAAVAAAFAVGVVEPFNSGLGGIAQLVYYEASSGRTYVVDGTSSLPRAARPELFPLAGGAATSGVYGWPAVTDDLNNTGYLAPVVPGTPACLCEALARFGTLPREVVMAPAIELAAQGYEIDYYVALALANQQARLGRFPASRRAFYRPDGTCYRAGLLGTLGDRLAQPDLARTLETIAREGSDAVYRGAIARRIADDMAANGGLVTADDLAAYRPRLFEPGLIGSYRGYQTVQAPLHTGAPTVLEALNILEGFEPAALAPDSSGPHLIAESLRRAFADRFAHLGDPALAPIPYHALTSKEYAAHRRADIDPARATPDAAPGDPWPFEPSAPPSDTSRVFASVPRPPRVGRGPGARPGTRGTFGGGGSPRRPSSATEPSPTSRSPDHPSPAPDTGQTTHLAVVDRHRNVVALTSTLGDYFGSGIVVEGTGIVLNNGAMWFDPRPGRVNSVAPGKRILWAGTPTILLRDGRPFLAIGAPGGRRILSAVLQTILNVIELGLGPQDAVAAPRLHCEGPLVEIDVRYGASAVAALRHLGHPVAIREETFTSSHFARPSAILIDPATNRLRAGVNQYKPALAIGL